LPSTLAHVRIVTDSTADLSPQEADRLGVTVVPLTVFFGSRGYLDGVDLSPPQFYDMLAASTTFPTTMPPDAERMYAAYAQLAASGATAIVSLHISSRLSETVTAARDAARRMDPRVPVAVIDTGQASVGMLPAVRFAAQMAQWGAPLDAIKAEVRGILDRTRVYFVVDTLEYLQRGGRIGRAQRLLGTLLDAKPLLTVTDGEVAPVETVRSRQRAHERLAELVQGWGPLAEVYVGQTTDELGMEMIGRIRGFFGSYLQRTWIGATVGSHVGIGVGVAAVKGAPRR
jgi:DegV family protein with EDD domain